MVEFSGDACEFTAILALEKENYGMVAGLWVGAVAIRWQLGRLYLCDEGSFRKLVYSEI